MKDINVYKQKKTKTFNYGGKRMKTKKRLLSIVLALAIVISGMIIPGTAVKAADTKTIKINDVTHGNYNAYQIFTGVVSGTAPDYIMGDIAWGDGVDKTALVTALKAETSPLKGYFTSVDGTNPTAESVAKGLVAIKAETNADELLREFSKLAAAAKVSANKIAGTYNSTAKTITIENLVEGYYLVLDEATVADDANDANSSYIIQVVADVEMSTKMEVPTIDKKIIEGTQNVVANEASIGDRVYFEVITTVPDMTGYTAYYYVINDTLDDGLTFGSDVYIVFQKGLTGEHTLGIDEYTVSKDGQKVKIIIKDFLNKYKDKKGGKFTIAYSASVNENALLGNTGNKNTASLTFSNDPSYDYDGSKDEPGTGDPTGKTPDSVTTTYTYGIKLAKVDGADDSPLTGAKFKIASDDVTFITKINSEIYKEDASGTYHRLKDGTYSDSATLTEDDCDGGLAAKYSKVTGVKHTTDKTTVAKESYVDAAGLLTFEGLGAGTYKLTELVAPTGYNTITDPIAVTIKADYTDPSAPVFKYVDSTGTEQAIPDDGIIPWKVENNKGLVLPSTGGMGTTLFYIIGGALVLVAGILLITKKRMDKED